MKKDINIKMTLDEYITKAIAELKTFNDDWHKNHEFDAETWPLEMAEGDWIDQELAERFS